MVIEKKRIVAPFRARVGITNLQPGAYLDVGSVIGRLQGVETGLECRIHLAQA